MSVITVLRYGEYLIVAFYLQGQTVFKLNPNEFQNLMQNGFAFRIERYIVSVFSTALRSASEPFSQVLQAVHLPSA